MIGVVSNSLEESVVREFFELFKTPWEFYKENRKYDVILCDGPCTFDENAAKLILIYSGRKLPVDDARGMQVLARGNDARTVPYREFQIPIYGDQVSFHENTRVSLSRELPSKPIYHSTLPGREVVRIGYDLFAEVRALLTTGQPSANAAVPTLELHIELLRDLILSSGITLSEIPPVPDGYRFIACLTHDVDHPMIRRHKLDHTMFGFLYRAVCASLADAIQGRISWQQVLTNWAAALKLPLVHLGLARDCWSDFDRGYTDIEGNAKSTFFVIPFEGRTGRTQAGTAPNARAARYGAADISSQIQNLTAAGCEIGLHGIDAWINTSTASEELEEIRKVTGKREIGVRMHWLYFDDQSPITLENAGVSYDSTVGYNDTVGYRAGTTQAYKPLGAAHLMELPLHVMDTALFYPSYLDLSTVEARKRVWEIIDHAVRFGGSITVNWHDRSIAAERLWGNFYVELIAELKARGAWIATAEQSVAWFRKRRSAAFEEARGEAGNVRVEIEAKPGSDLPALQLHVQPGREQGHFASIESTGVESRDFRRREKVETCVVLPFEMEAAAERN
jgi:hypothetical protein